MKNDFPLGLAFVLNAVKEVEEVQAKRDEAWDEQQRENERLAAEAKAEAEAETRKVVPINRNTTMPPPPNRRAA